MAPAAHKGTAMGAYSTSQFFGVFLGGIGGGWCVSQWGNESVFLMNMTLALVWLGLILGMTQPDYHSSYLLNVGVMDEQRAKQIATQLTGITGVVEALVIAAEGVAYLKVDLDELDLDALTAYSVSPSEV
jgi:MFS family permease